jgi:hypothetical protein
MIRRRRWQWAAAGTLAGVVTAAHGAAFADELEPLTVGFGIIGAAGANFIDAPQDQSITVGGRTATPVTVPEYPGFAGPTYGVGPFVDIRIFEYAGLEIELLRTTDRGRADLQLVRAGASRDYVLEIAQDAFHLALLFKSVLPTGLARPLLLLGPELVLPDRGTAEVVEGESPLAPQLAASATSYTMLTWGAGGELDLPIPSVDVRVAATLRGSVTPGLGDGRAERATYFGADVHRLDGIIYRTRWRYKVLGTLTVGAYF